MLKILSTVSIFALITVGFSSAQDPKPPLPLPQPQQPVIEQLKKTVVFIETAGQGPATLLGTGFLISVPLLTISKDQSLTWLVTAKHVLRQLSPDRTPGPYRSEVRIRFNLLVPTPQSASYIGEEIIKVMDEDGHFYWTIDPHDESVDAAMIQISIDASKADYLTTSTEQFLSDRSAKEISLNENDEVLFSGLFEAYPGTNKNYPIIRHGRLALVPEEKISVRLSPTVTLSEDIYLAEITSFGGNSGSPVFLRIPPLRETTTTRMQTSYDYRLLGVMQGFFNVPEAMDIQLSQIHGVGQANSGIAAIVPAQKILDILQSPRARAQTEFSIANTYARDGKLQEAAPAYKEALDLMSRVLDPEHPTLAYIMAAYASVLQKLGRNVEAGSFKARAQSILDKHQTPH
jgi:tetratricopeptide (TPR) repeat protein